MNEPETRDFNPEVIQRDPWLYRLVVIVLGLTAVACIAAEVILLAVGQSGNSGLTAIGAAAIGALGGMIAPSPNR